MSKTYRMREPSSGDVFEVDPAERVRLLGKGYEDMSETEIDPPTAAVPHTQPGTTPFHQHSWPATHDDEV